MDITIKAYYDCSGKLNDSNSKYLTLAGYIGTPLAWQHFEENWNNVLHRWNCKYLHMREAHPLWGEFAKEKGWTADRVNFFIKDLFNECFSPTGWGKFRNQFYGTSCTINLEDYRRFCSETVIPCKKIEEICLDYVLTIALMALPENPYSPFGKGGTVELYFDKNESFMNIIYKIWSARPSHKTIGPLQFISSIKKADMHQVIGLQAADFLAWHTNRSRTGNPNDDLREASLSAWNATAMRVFASPTYSRYYDYERLKKELDKI